MNKLDFAFGKLPNGWPNPTFMSVDEGAFFIEWCFGDQGSKDSWRVSFYWDLQDGAMVIKTDAQSQECYENDPQLAFKLNEWLSNKNG